MTIRVLIADDHAIVRTGLRALLKGEASMDLVGEATCGEEALILTRDLRPDILVLDLSMPDIDGIQVTHQLKREQPDVRVLILTVHEMKLCCAKRCVPGPLVISSSMLLSPN